MIKFGIIGTNWISAKFVNAIKNNPNCEVAGVYSRASITAKEFIEKIEVGAVIYSNLKEMLKSEDINAVYIASPNSLHGEQSYLCLSHNKHVICEKPIATDLEIFDRNLKLAEKNNLVYMEAMKTTLLPNFKVIEDNLEKISPIRNVRFNYSQYSSRYDELKNGGLPNVFNPEFHGGSAFDLGVYPLYVALRLFGIPNTYTGRNIILDSGVDGAGSISLTYSDKIISIGHSKITETHIPCEILGEKGSIVIDKISTLGKVELVSRTGKKTLISKEQKDNEMEYELTEFISLIKKNKIESKINTFEISRASVEILSKVRTRV